jgi:hypothetical protein
MPSLLFSNCFTILLRLLIVGLICKVLLLNRNNPTLAETRNHSGNGWAASYLDESPTFYSKFPRSHQRIAYRKGGGHVEGCVGMITRPVLTSRVHENILHRHSIAIPVYCSQYNILQVAPDGGVDVPVAFLSFLGSMVVEATSWI